MQLVYYGDTLYHHGIKGQRWGVRRYQNADGTLTYAGRKRYIKESKRDINETKNRLVNLMETNSVWQGGKSGRQVKSLATKLKRKSTITKSELKKYEKKAKKYMSDQGKNYLTLKSLDSTIKSGHEFVKLSGVGNVNVYGKLQNA